jgi:hypothetical protein
MSLATVSTSSINKRGTQLVGEHIRAAHKMAATSKALSQLMLVTTITSSTTTHHIRIIAAHVHWFAVHCGFHRANNINKIGRTFRSVFVRELGKLNFKRRYSVGREEDLTLPLCVMGLHNRLAYGAGTMSLATVSTSSINKRGTQLVGEHIRAAHKMAATSKALSQMMLVTTITSSTTTHHIRIIAAHVHWFAGHCGFHRANNINKIGRTFRSVFVRELGKLNFKRRYSVGREEDAHCCDLFDERCSVSGMRSINCNPIYATACFGVPVKLTRGRRTAILRFKRGAINRCRLIVVSCRSVSGNSSATACFGVPVKLTHGRRTAILRFKRGAINRCSLIVISCWSVSGSNFSAA